MNPPSLLYRARVWFILLGLGIVVAAVLTRPWTRSEKNDLTAPGTPASAAVPAETAETAETPVPAAPTPPDVPESTPNPPAPTAPAAAEVAPPLFQRIVLLGASVTAGFDASQPFGGPKTLQLRFANFVEAAVAGTHEPVATQANALLFMHTPEMMDKQITATLAAKPSLVIGIDALLWFCYGSGMTSEQRLARFETGLRQLERIDVPLVVGDLPDASKAVGGTLDKDQMPALAVIAQCNERLKTWAAGRKEVTLFSLARIMAAAQANEEISISGLTWEKGKSRDLLQEDWVHPTKQGLTALAIAVLDAAAASAHPPLSPVSVRHDLDMVFNGGVTRGELLTAHPKAVKPQN